MNHSSLFPMPGPARCPLLIPAAAVMFSLVSSRYALSIRFTFLATNAVGILLGAIYNAQTPDLYPGNAHHSIGWIVTWVVMAQASFGLLGRISRHFGGAQARGYSSVDHHNFAPVPREASCEQTFPSAHGHRLSNDSIHGMEPRTESVRSSSVSTAYDEDASPSPYKELDDEECRDFEAMPTSVQSSERPAWTGKAAVVVPWTLWKYVKLGCKVIDRIIMPFGFVAFATGIITYARFFVRLHHSPFITRRTCQDPPAAHHR